MQLKLLKFIEVNFTKKRIKGNPFIISESLEINLECDN